MGWGEVEAMQQARLEGGQQLGHQVYSCGPVTHTTHITICTFPS
jgi:hypothetical protein